MIYLDIIMTDKPDANEITPKVDHKAYLLKDVLKKPKLSFWDLYKFKKHLETGYEKLKEEINIGESTNEKGIQSKADDSGESLELQSGDNRESIEKDTVRVESN